MKILVTGDRNWDNGMSVGVAIWEVMSDFGIDSPTEDVVIVHGAARGADSLAHEVALLLGLTPKPYPAHWGHTKDCPPDCKRMVGRPAGVIRNQQMLDENPDIDIALAFHSNLEKSKGTKDMIRRVEKKGIEYRLFTE